MAIPDQRIIGWAIVLFAIALFAVQVRYESGHVQVGWGRAERARMWPIIGMTLSALAFILFGIWYVNASSEGIQLKITKAYFDLSGPTEFYIDFTIANLGKPTTLENWNLKVERNGVELWRHEPRVTFQPTYNANNPRALNPPLDLAREPLVSGEQVKAHFTWTYEGNAKEKFGFPGTIFKLTAIDIRGREVEESYTLQ